MKPSWLLRYKPMSYVSPSRTPLAITAKHPPRIVNVTGNLMARRHIFHSTERNVIISSNKSIGDLPSHLTIPEYMFENQHEFGDRKAITCGVTGRSYTYDEWYEACRIFAASLRNKFKIQDGDVIQLALPNGLEYPVALLGGLHAGAIVSPVSPTGTSDELIHQLKLSEAKVIITTSEAYENAKKANSNLQKNIPIIVVRDADDSSIPAGAIDFNDLSSNTSIDKSCLKEVRRTIDDVAIMPFSSGTTGLPKAVELTHKNIISNCQQAWSLNSQYVLPTTQDYQDCVMSVLPQFHIYELTGCLLSKLRGGLHMVTLPGFNPGSFLEAIRQYRPTLIQVVPLLVQFMGAHPIVTSEHLSSFRYLCCGAAPLAAIDFQRIFDKTNGKTRTIQGYGLTETSPLILLQEADEADPTTVGKPVSDTELKVVDINTGEALGPDKTGELWIRGPQVMRGYHSDPVATADTLTADGWLKTGDIARYNTEHTFHIADRLKELIKVKGYQVPPAELEGILRQHPSVLDAAVVAIPDSISGEAPKAYVVTKDDTVVPEEELMKFVAGKVSEYKQIVEVQFVDSIPKTPSGKILRRLLRSM